jgi:serine/threonine-protein kinase RsbT
LIPNTKDRKGIKVIAQDKGPGIEDVDRVLAGGYTTSKGLGMGISGSKKIMDEFDIQTVIGGGTTIKCTKWLD